MNAKEIDITYTHTTHTGRTSSQSPSYGNVPKSDVARGQTESIVFIDEMGWMPGNAFQALSRVNRPRKKYVPKIVCIKRNQWTLESALELSLRQNIKIPKSLIYRSKRCAKRRFTHPFTTMRSAKEMSFWFGSPSRSIQ